MKMNHEDDDDDDDDDDDEDGEQDPIIHEEGDPSKKPTGFLFLIFSTLSSSGKHQGRRPRGLCDERTSQGKIFTVLQCFHDTCIACIAPRQVLSKMIPCQT